MAFPDVRPGGRRPARRFVSAASPRGCPTSRSARSTPATSRCSPRGNGARKAVEIGTLGGYSGVSLLRGMGIDGMLDTIEIEPRHAEVARESFRRAGYSTPGARPPRRGAGDPAHARPARTVRSRASSTPTRRATADYLHWAADNLRPGGLVLLDNAFLFGDLPEKPTGERAVSIARHAGVARDPRAQRPLPRHAPADRRGARDGRPDLVGDGGAGGAGRERGAEGARQRLVRRGGEQ